jgi:hypothetical protein
VFEPLRRLARWRRRHPVLPLIGDTRTRAEREANALRTTVKALGVGTGAPALRRRLGRARRGAAGGAGRHRRRPRQPHLPPS